LEINSINGESTWGAITLTQATTSVTNA